MPSPAPQNALHLLVSYPMNLGAGTLINLESFDADKQEVAKLN